MTTPCDQEPPATLAQRLTAMVERHGSPEERKLLGTHEDAVRHFLQHPDVHSRTRRNVLDIGLENRLVLKLNLISNRRGSPWGLIDEIGGRAPRLRRAADEIIRYRLQCHAGLKISAAGLEYELYPFEDPANPVIDSLYPGGSAGDTGLPTGAYCYGLSSTGELSAYAQMPGVDPAELEEASGIDLPAEGLKARALFHSRRDDLGQWTPGKAGIEFMPFPSYLLNIALARLNLHFSYLVYRGGERRYGVIGVKGTRNVLYTTLLPKRASTASTDAD